MTVKRKRFPCICGKLKEAGILAWFTPAVVSRLSRCTQIAREVYIIIICSPTTGEINDEWTCTQRCNILKNRQNKYNIMLYSFGVCQSLFSALAHYCIMRLHRYASVRVGRFRNIIHVSGVTTRVPRLFYVFTSNRGVIYIQTSSG